MYCSYESQRFSSFSGASYEIARGAADPDVTFAMAGKGFQYEKGLSLITAETRRTGLSQSEREREKKTHLIKVRSAL